MKLLGSSVFALAGLAASSAHADGRIPIGKPSQITAPGHYVVTHDLAGPGPLGVAPLEVTSTDVELDLDGHTITAGGPIAIYLAPGLTSGSVVVRNGQVRADTYGIWHPGDSASRVRLERLDLSGGGGTAQAPIVITGAPIVEVVGCTVHDSSCGTAIWVTRGVSPRWTGLLTGNAVRDVGGDGFYLNGMYGGVVSENVVVGYGTAATGIALAQSEGVLLEGNVLHGEASNVSRSGIHFYPGASHRHAILDNVISGGMDVGLYLGGDGSLVTGNVIGGTEGVGIFVYGSENAIVHNLVESGTLYGVQVAGQHTIVDANSIQGHTGFGLGFNSGAGSAYRGNFLRNNLSGAVSGTATDAGGNIP